MGIKLFVDGADILSLVAATTNPRIQGITTNPTLMRQAGVGHYLDFARALLAACPTLPISFEVIADDFPTMHAQARTLAALSPYVYVKIPITDTQGEPSHRLIHALAHEGIHVNVTAVMTQGQAAHAIGALRGGPSSIVSIFAGRIADTGRDPTVQVKGAVAMSAETSTEILWASPREVLNISEAEQCGCHIITATSHILAKLSLADKDLTVYSRETVQMFYHDACAAGYTL